MGKEKIEEKDVRLLRYAVEQAFDASGTYIGSCVLVTTNGYGGEGRGIGTVEPSGRFGFGSGKS